MLSIKLTYRELLIILGFYGISLLVGFYSLTLVSSSMLSGLLLALVLFLIISLPHGIRYLFSVPLFVFMLVFTAITSVLYLGTLQLFEGADHFRFFGSILVLLFLFFCSVIFAPTLMIVRNTVFNKAVYVGFYFLMMIGFISLMLINNGFFKTKHMIIFTEPSHYALSLLPFLLYVSYRDRTSVKLYFYLSAVLILALAINNLTLIVGVFLIISILYRKNIIGLFMLFAVIFIAFSFIDMNYVVDRLNFFGNVDNLSTLVFLSGWERAYLSLKDSYGLGIGFQQMGIVGNNGEYQVIIQSLTENRVNLNMYDGGSLAPKIIAELGFFGVLLISTYIYFAFKIISLLVLNQISDSQSIFMASVYLMFFMELFIRGMGYFSLTSFMFIASCCWFYFTRVKVGRENAK